MMKFNHMNPVRFRVRESSGDFDTKQITIDQYAIGDTVYDGVYPVNYMPKFQNGTNTPFQFSSEVDIDELDCTLIDSDGGETTLTLIDITPTGWTGDNIFKANISATYGCYYVTVEDAINSDIAVSDVFQVATITNEDIKITYQNSENVFNNIFFDGSTENFEGLVFLPGHLIDFDSSQDISSYETDRGEIQKLRATPVINYDLKLYNINIAYAKMVNMIFSLDTITINGQGFDNSDAPSVERIEDSDLCNITVKVRQKNYNYYYDA